MEPDFIVEKAESSAKVIGGTMKRRLLLAAASVFALSVVPAFSAEMGTDFSDEKSDAPWGFSTSGAVLRVSKSAVAGNATPKLEFGMENQKGGRVATKKFSPAVTGKTISVSFDWFPGKINDKGSNPDENGGQVTFIDSDGKTAFALDFTHNGSLSYRAGNGKPVALPFARDDVWYSVSLLFDVRSGKISGTVKDSSSGNSADIAAEVSGGEFSGVIAKMTLTGIRTSGNNITWTTFLDNVNFAVEAISKNSITTVAPLPYARVYTGTAKDVKGLNLPKKVPVTLANGLGADATVSSWKSVGKEWDCEKEGVYTFEGTIPASGIVDNDLNKKAVQYVYNRLPVPETERQAEWLDRGVVAVKADKGIFVSWRIRADEFKEKLSFNVLKNGTVVAKKLSVANYLDKKGKPGDVYTVETYKDGALSDTAEAKASADSYLSIKVQKPEGGENGDGPYTYSMNDATVGDLDGDGSYEIIVKWYPSDAIDSSKATLTGPTLFDAYKLDGTPLWRIDMGLNLTSGAHYNQIVVADFDGDGKSEVFLKTADATTVYGVTDGKIDTSNVIGVIGNASDNGKWISREGKSRGHVTGGPEYVTFFEGMTGKILDTVEYEFPVGNVSSWGDTWYNRSDRWNACAAYLDGTKPSAVLGRGYYARTAYAAYDLVDGKARLRWSFDSAKEGRGGALGNHNLAVADVDNDGKDEIVAGDLTLDDDGTILYAMDGEMLREKGSHADAIHIGQFDPEVEGLYVWQPREEPAVASLVLHDAATGEAKLVYYAAKDAGRAMAANITKEPGYNFWGAGGSGAEKGGSVYNIYGETLVDRSVVPSMNFKIYWDGDLLHELLDDLAPLDCINLYKFDELSRTLKETVRFTGTHSNNSTKANPSLQADILGDWREEVVVPSDDDTELRIYTTTEPTKYLIYTLMHDPVYRLSVAWQNNGYNQPPCLSFYLGEDISKTVRSKKIPVPSVIYPGRK